MNSEIIPRYVLLNNKYEFSDLEYNCILIRSYYLVNKDFIYLLPYNFEQTDINFFSVISGMNQNNSKSFIEYCYSLLLCSINSYNY